jgi:uncharacterized protein YdaU (DUF1376 family)
MHYYPKNIGDYRRDTMNLSLLEHGVYTTLIDHYTLNEEPISLDHLDVCWTIGARTDNEKTAVCLILSKFFIKTDEGYRHKRCDEEIAKYHAKSDTARVNANKRWDSNTKAMQTHSKGNANHKPITNNQEPLTNKDFDKFWEAYPKKRAKPVALKAWLKHKPDIDVVIKSLTIIKKCDQWTKNKGEFIPYPASWLNAEGWNDVIETKKLNKTYL